MDKVNSTTYKSVAGGIETVVGDEKQPDFYPRVKIKKWNNEVNFSVGLKNAKGKHRRDKDKVIFESGTTTAEFYAVPKPSTNQNSSKKLRWLDLGGIEPYAVSAEYELSRHIPGSDITIVTYFCKTPALMYFGQYKASDYVDQVDIPQVRAASSTGNPYYMDPGLLMIDIHFNGNSEDGALTKWTQATQDILKNEYGISAYTKTGAKLYYKDSQGNDVKIASPEWNWGHIWTYLNIDCNYLKAYDYYKSTRPKNIRDPHAYGLKKNYPSVDNTVLNKIVTRFAQLSNLDLTPDTYTPAEKNQITALKDTLTSKEWVSDAKRSDFDWWYVDPSLKNIDKFEFGITLSQPPTSNIIPLTIQTKDLRFFYQGEEAKENTYRPFDVVGSYAVYHASKANNHYQTGKAFHIYRPWARDAEGNRVWCDLEIDLDGNGFAKKDEISITIPKDFINNAQYPVFIDPTFGYTTQGASNYVIAAHNGVNPGISTLVNQPGSEVGYATSMSAYISVASSGDSLNYKYALYSSDTKAISGKTTISANFTSNQSVALQTLNFGAVTFGNQEPTTPDIRNINYDLAVWANEAPGNYGFVSIYYDTQPNAGIDYDMTTMPSGNNWPSNLNSGPTATTVVNNRYSIYSTYTPVATSVYRIAEQDNSNSSNGATVSCSIPYVPQQGSFLLAAVYANKAQGTNSLISLSGGWTTILDQGFNANAATLTLFAKLAGANENQTLQAQNSSSATAMQIHIFNFTGNVTSSLAAAQDAAAASNQNASATSAATPTAITANANDIVLVFCALSANFSSAASWNNSFNMVSATGRLFSGERIVTSTGSYSSTASWTSSRPSATAIVTIKADSSTVSKNLPTLGVG